MVAELHHLSHPVLETLFNALADVGKKEEWRRNREVKNSV